MDHTLSTPRRIARTCLLAAALFSTACAHNHYQIELQPDGDALDRSLNFWRQRGGDGMPELEVFPQNELEAIARAYGQDAPPAAAMRYFYRGRFAGKMPQDLGGSGGYNRWVTQMGTLYLYAERFRGNDDLLASMDGRRAAARTLAELIGGWVHSQMSDDPDFDKLDIFLHQRLLPDLENLAVYCWTVDAVQASAFQGQPPGDHPALHELCVRVGRYLVERDYFTPEDLPHLLRITEQQDGQRLLTFARNLLAARMGLRDPDEVRRRLRFLSDPQEALASLKAHVEKSEAYQIRLQHWRQEHVAQPDATPPEPGDYLGELAASATGFDLRPADQLQVHLRCPVRPFSTNGVWNEQDGSIGWTAQINAAGERPAPVLPAVLYAAWSEPDRAFQQAHFGKVALEGQRLGDYCLWRAALTEAEAIEWDAFVAGLKPDEHLKPAVEAFRFSTDPKPGPENGETLKSLADQPRKLILEGLQ